MATHAVPRSARSNKPKKVRSEFAVSAKRLGELNSPHACPRCFWIRDKLHGVGRDTPFSFGMAGILSRLDSLQKKMIHETPGDLPAFLSHYQDWTLLDSHRMYHTDLRTGIELSGVPDLIFQQMDELAIIDLKSSKPKDTPASGDKSAFLKISALYGCQLNVYKFMVEAAGLGKVTKLSLMYLWPRSLEMEGRNAKAIFDATEVSIVPDETLVPRLLGKARDILISKRIPAPRNDCLDCCRMAHLLSVLGLESARDAAVLENVRVFVP